MLESHVSRPDCVGRNPEKKTLLSSERPSQISFFNRLEEFG